MVDPKFSLKGPNFPYPGSQKLQIKTVPRTKLLAYCDLLQIGSVQFTGIITFKLGFDFNHSHCTVRRNCSLVKAGHH